MSWRADDPQDDDPAPLSDAWVLVLALVLALVLSFVVGCAPAVRFEGVTTRPDGYGGGYQVVANCRKGTTTEPCIFLCSPEIGGGIACGRLPVLWW